MVVNIRFKRMILRLNFILFQSLTSEYCSNFYFKVMINIQFIKYTRTFRNIYLFTQKVPISTVQIILLKVNHSLTTFVVVATLVCCCLQRVFQLPLFPIYQQNWEYSSCQFCKSIISAYLQKYL